MRKLKLDIIKLTQDGSDWHVSVQKQVTFYGWLNLRQNSRILCDFQWPSFLTAAKVAALCGPVMHCCSESFLEVRPRACQTQPQLSDYFVSTKFPWLNPFLLSFAGMISVM